MPSLTAPDRSLVRDNIASVSVRELAERFGTPLFVYDESPILQRIADLQAFDAIRFAQKACSNLAIMDTVRRHGCLVDAVSTGEIHRALAAGYQTVGNPPPIVYTADIFDRESLDLVVEREIHVNCGSPDMITMLGQRAPGREITLRINPGFGHGHSQKTNTGGDHSKHGIWHEDLPECLKQAKQFDLRVTGLHVHIGSGTDLKHLSQVCQAMERFARLAGEHLVALSAGGGLPIPYRSEESFIDLDAYYQLWDATRNRLAEELGRPLRLEVEPGRYLVAESGYLIAEIRAVKRMGDNTFYLVDAGFNNLARPVMYGAYHPMSICSVGDDSADAREAREVVVGGPLCESGDIFTQREGGYVCTQPLPEANIGDLLIVENAGAYGFVMGSNYNSKPLAAEVLVRDGWPHLIRARQNCHELFAGECIPTT